MKRTGICKYDAERVALVPMQGMTEQDANAFLKTAEKHGWDDLKVVQTRDVHKTLALVLKPKTWVNIVTLQALKGARFPDGYIHKFETECAAVLGEHKDPEIHKEELTKEEKELKKKVLEKLHEKEEAGGYEDQDTEDKAWEQEEDENTTGRKS